MENCAGDKYRRTKNDKQEKDDLLPSITRSVRMLFRNAKDSAYSVDRLTVFNPASVIAETARKRLSIYRTRWAWVEEPQKMREATKHVPQM